MFIPKLHGAKKSIAAVIFLALPCFIFPLDTELDNPWLCLKAIQETYRDIAGDFFFDSEENDWCIQIRNSYLYWANGRLLPKKKSSEWKSWKPYISYFYPEAIPNPQNYSKSFIEKLKPDFLIKHRRFDTAPNYDFQYLVYQGKTKSEIIKQLRKIKFFGIEIWVHKRVSAALKRIEKEIISLQKNDAAVRLFIKNIGSCWGFNWRVIVDSGKLSNHCWGTAIDILPKNYRNKKIYWYWEAVKNSEWMKIPPYKRWAPPDVIIKIFEKEGFIWGGKWDVWDNMHFEYRPELIYIRNFILSKAENKPKSSDAQLGYNSILSETGQESIRTVSKQNHPSPFLNAVLKLASAITQVQYLMEELKYKYESAEEFFKAELADEHEPDEKEIDTTILPDEVEKLTE